MKTVTLTWRAFSDERDMRRYTPPTSKTVLVDDDRGDLELCEAFFVATNTYGDAEHALWQALQPLPDPRSHTSLSVVFDMGDYVEVDGRVYEVADAGFARVV